MSQFFAMGGYALYVWSAYALAFVVVVWQLVAPWRCERRILRRIARAQQRRGRDESGTP